MEDVIHEEISLQFSRADTAPIYQGSLFELLGYRADTETVLKILKGTFILPHGTDPAAVIILQ